MISEEQLQEWDRLAYEAPRSYISLDSTKDEDFIYEAYECVPALIAEVRRLQEEADWLAEKLTSSFCLSRQVKYKKMCKGCELYDFGSPIEGETRGLMDKYREQAKKCWCEAARKAVSNEQD